MIAWRIKFLASNTMGYQLMYDDGRVIGLYRDDGTPFPNPGDYTTTDVGLGPRIGVSLPGFAAGLSVPAEPVEPVQVPQAVSPYQARIALLNAGLLDAVNALMANPQTPKAAVIAWEYATAIERNSPFIASLAPALSLSDAQVDALFTAASQVADN